MAKHLHIAELLETRICHGDYLLQSFPTDRELAAEVGASNVTARKAVQHLIDQGLLIRQPNGRSVVKRATTATKRLRIALLSVAYPSPVLDRWHQRIGKLSEERDWLVRMIGFSHEDDPLIQQTLENFDGIFFGPMSMAPTPALIDRLRASPNPVIVLESDWSAQGVRVLRLESSAAVRRLLGRVGRPNIACLNTQPRGAVIQHRIEQWQLWVAAHGEAAELIDEPVEQFGSAMWQAYRVVSARLKVDHWDGKALFCTTCAAAKGAMRALAEHGLEIGKQVAVCAADDGGGEAPLCIPSLTSLQMPDARPYLSVCLDWMARRERDWLGPMLIEPAETPVFVGESTGNRSATVNPRMLVHDYRSENQGHMLNT